MKRTALARKTPLRRGTRLKVASRYRPTTKMLDALCREVVFLRDKGTCQKCGKPAVDWAHIDSRRFRSTRWRLENSCALCKGCHLLGHHRPRDFARWFADTFPDRDMALSLMARSGGKVDLGAVKLYLEAERAKLEAR